MTELHNLTAREVAARYADKTPMPAGEDFASLARHVTTMAIHLGVKHLSRIVDELLPHYGADCPVAIVWRASWPIWTRPNAQKTWPCRDGACTR